MAPGCKRTCFNYLRLNGLFWWTWSNSEKNANETETEHVCVCDFDVISAKDVATRQRYVRLVDGVREGAGTVRIFSSLHVSGERELYFFVFQEHET